MNLTLALVGCTLVLAADPTVTDDQVRQRDLALQRCPREREEDASEQH